VEALDVLALVVRTHPRRLTQHRLEPEAAAERRVEHALEVARIDEALLDDALAQLRNQTAALDVVERAIDERRPLAIPVDVARESARRASACIHRSRRSISVRYVCT